VIIVVLPAQMLEPRMPNIVPGLMVYSKENKGRLRAKVKGILDRCLRKFSAAQVESWVSGDDRKMIINIRKRRDRAKKKNKGEIVDSDEDESTTRKYDNEFDEAVYGSDDDASEIEGSDDDDTMSGVSLKKPAGRRQQQYIRQEEDDDEPLDLLDPRSMASITTKKLGRLKDTSDNTRKTKAKVNEDGKLIFGGPDEVDNDTAMTNGEQGDSSVNAYVEAVSGADVVRRGQKGRLKVKSGMQKKTKQENKSRDKDEMDLDVEEARQVARQIMQGSPRSPGGRRDGKQQRRGLGVEKTRAQAQRQKFRGGNGVGKRGGKVRFGGRNGERR
jgi:ribosomal RNA-processing protein 12